MDVRLVESGAESRQEVRLPALQADRSRRARQSDRHRRRRRVALRLGACSRRLRLLHVQERKDLRRRHCLRGVFRMMATRVHNAWNLNVALDSMLSNIAQLCL